jgi:hypothetical protein
MVVQVTGKLAREANTLTGVRPPGTLVHRPHPALQTLPVPSCPPSCPLHVPKVAVNESPAEITMLVSDG